MKNKIITVTLNPSIDKTIEISGFVYGGLNRVQSERIDVGGKGINVSKVLKSFEADSVATGIAAGRQGRLVIDFLNSEKIDNHFVLAGGETRTNYKIVNTGDSVITEINEPGVFVSDEVLEEFLTKLKSLLPQADIMILSGSIPKGVEKDIYNKLILMAKAFDIKTILDADGEILRLCLDAKPYAIKPNLFELEQLTGKRLRTSDEIISAVRGLGIHLAAVSMGSDGALFISEDKAYRATPFKIKPESAVGAGDSMVAAMAFCIRQNYTLEQTARFATAAGTITASKPGTQVCKKAEILGKYKDVAIDFL